MIFGGVNRYRYSLQVNRPQETQHMLFTVQGKVERVLRFYRRWVSCQIYSFSSTCPPLSRAEPRAYTHPLTRTGQCFHSRTTTFLLLNSREEGSAQKLVAIKIFFLLFAFFVNRLLIRAAAFFFVCFGSSEVNLCCHLTVSISHDSARSKKTNITLTLNISACATFCAHGYWL